jgi:3-phosphoshikimate 1-carboxyvinyltransferase
MKNYPAQLPLEPLPAPPTVTVRVPGSKSITNRALPLAALLARAQTLTLTGCLHSEDTEVMVTALQQLGFGVQIDWPTGVATLHTPAAEPLIPATSADLFVANSGTTMRFLTALVALGHGIYRLDGIPRMRERPIADLLAALSAAGVAAQSVLVRGYPPVEIRAAGLAGGRLRVRGDVSSQFLTGLLLAAPFARQATTITVDGPMVSQPYIDMTVTMLRQFGIAVERPEPGIFQVPGQRTPPPATYAIEPDASAASYFLAAAAVTGGQVTVTGMDMGTLQGDALFADLLVEMGCNIELAPTGMTIVGRPLHGIRVDMNAISDTVMTLAVVACFAAGPTTIHNVAHIRHKETDRLSALATELRKVGVRIDERPDGLTITPGPLRGATLATYNDHRMAMSLALLGLRIPGIVIDQPGCVVKTYPGFWHDWEQLRQPTSA